MIKTIPYKLIVASALLTMTTTSVVSPVAAFASEMEQTNNEDMSFSANEAKMKEALQKAGLFAKSMNEYSYLLINNPDVNFEGITINGYEDLPGKIVQDQRNARAHAVTWDTQVKRQLLDTLTGIIEYDTTFDNYYDTLVQAMNDGDGDTLKEGITDFRAEIQQNQAHTQKLIQELTKLRDNIGQDVRAFGSNKDQLYSILKNQTAGLEDDQKRLDDLLGQVNHYKKLESDGFTTMKVGIFGLWWIGGIIVGTARDNLGKIEPYLAEVRKTVDSKTTLNRVVGVAYNNIDQMHKAIDNAINALTYMSTQWHDLDSQYSGVLGHIEKVSEKADQNKFKFLKPNLNAAKDSWKTLKTDAVTLKEGIKELKVEPVTPQK
ncbi:alpha-helical pore-forming toxin family protein [Bacillus paramycoides]|uniref:hemolysin BL binding component B n=1 Tax=Bacillus paramycoides TaxID=2026194 RepID=UPI0015C1C572|nr:HBL/NHE enterotoxin family protein [Bacillus paramycoides]NWK69051.1 alpha-helical pore-forming toxin family protein [Bacillus paramycoides]